MRSNATMLSLLFAILAALIGVCFGAGLFTFHYGEGLSYFSKDPAACVNCHIMRPQYDSWQKASHHNVATCVDCHLPHTFVEKWIAKAENGFWHSKGFTLQDFHEPIFLRDKNKRILGDNCLVCHGDLASEILKDDSKHGVSNNCVHCHKSGGHGDSVGMGKFEQ